MTSFEGPTGHASPLEASQRVCEVVLSFQIQIPILRRTPPGHLETTNNSDSLDLASEGFAKRCEAVVAHRHTHMPV